MSTRALEVGILAGSLAFWTGRHWHSPAELGQFWLSVGVSVVLCVLVLLLLVTLEQLLLVRMRRDWQSEWIATVAYLRHEAEENRRLSRDPTAEVLRCDLELAAVVLANAADDLEHRLHVASRSRS